MLASLPIAFAAALVGGRLYLRWSPRRALDLPNQRSSHTQPTPRGGGLVIVGGFLLGLGVWLASGGSLSPRAIGWLVGALLVASVSFIDDLRPLPAAPRLLTHFLGAAILTVAGVQERDAPLAIALPLAFVYITGVTNVYNFMDGIDGLATVQAVIAGMALATAGLMIGNPLISICGGLLAAASAGFLVYNLPPARLFMGDIGSTFLGFSFAGLTLLGNIGVGASGVGAGVPERVPIEFGVVVLAPFLFDGLVTLVRRVLHGERWYTAHRSHYYQRLVQHGWSHAQVTGLYAGLAVVAALAAVAGVRAEPLVRAALAVVAYAPMLLVVALVWRLEADERRTAGEQPNDAPTVVLKSR